VLMLLFIREDDKRSIFNFIKMPFQQNNSAAGIVYFLGLLVPLILFLIFSFSTSQYLVPLAASNINQEIDVTYQQLAIQADPFFKFFITVFTAGSLEEFAFGFVLVIAGGLITMMFVGKNKLLDFGHNINKHLYALGGFMFSVLLFMGAHKLNASYTLLTMFIISAIFRFLLNFSIYYVGLGLIFAIGFHQANNFIYLINEYGMSFVKDALFSTGGIIILIYLLWVIAIIIYGFKDGIKGLKSDMKNRSLLNL